MSGKDKCRKLKLMREAIAKEHGIEGFEFKECDFQGDCIGTCPACETELQELTRLINEKKCVTKTLYGEEGYKYLSAMELDPHGLRGDINVIDTKRNVMQKFTFDARPRQTKVKKRKRGLKDIINKHREYKTNQTVRGGFMTAAEMYQYSIDWLAESTMYVVNEEPDQKTRKTKGVNDETKEILA